MQGGFSFLVLSFFLLKKNTGFKFDPGPGAPFFHFWKREGGKLEPNTVTKKVLCKPKILPINFR